MRIGLSFDQGTPKYALYATAVEAAARRYGSAAEILWLAGAARNLDPDALSLIDALVLTGGADVEPQRYGRDEAAETCKTFDGRDEAEIRILDRALERRIPTLAICRGMQLLNVYLGGTLVPDLPVSGHQLRDAERHAVSLESRSLLAQIVGDTAGEVTSSHHQAVDEPANDLQVAARHADGTIEAVEWCDPAGKPWLAAIQWHPERMQLDEPFAGPIYRSFLEAAATSRIG